MPQTPVLPASLDLLDRTELCVAGGGLAGVAAALASSAAGVETVLVEERGALGWEISHGLELYVATAPRPDGPSTFKDLLNELARHGAFREGMLDPVATECILDRLLLAAGVRLHFRAFAGSWQAETGIVRVTTKSGPLGIEARVVVDATESARLARGAGATFTPHSQIQDQIHDRAFLLCAVTPPQAPEKVDLEGLSTALLRPTLWPQVAHVQISYPRTARQAAESESRFLIARAIQELRRTRPGFEQASLALSAHEAFAAVTPKLDVAHLPERLFVAGPAVLGRRPTLEERAALGEQAVKTAREELHGIATH